MTNAGKIFFLKKELLFECYLLLLAYSKVVRSQEGRVYIKNTERIFKTVFGRSR